MKTWVRATAVTTVALLAWSGAAIARDKGAKKSAAPCDQTQPSASVGGAATPAPPQIAGQVTAIDQANGMVTIQGTDGQAHQFRANADTLKDLKVGDQLEAKLRSAPC
jgi:hypothetical protein